MSRKLPGLRAALITDLLIVVLGLGGAAAYALWSQSGTVTATVTAGTWAPSPGTQPPDTPGNETKPPEPSPSATPTPTIPVTPTPTAPTPGMVNPVTVICTRGEDMDSSSTITVRWKGVEAQKYELAVSPTSGITPNPTEVPQTGVGQTVSKTLTFKWPNGSGRGVYDLSIAAKSDEKTGPAIHIAVDLIGKKEDYVTCTPR